MSERDPDWMPSGFLAQLVLSCPDAIVFADATGHIRFWNDAATRIFGHAASEAIGARLDLIIPERLRARHWQGYHQIMAGGKSHYGEGAVLAVPALHRDGRQISVEFTVQPVRDAAGALLGIAAYLRDTTVRFEEIRALRRELAALKAS